MARTIIVYGNPDKSELGFKSPGVLKEYIRRDIFISEKARYRYTVGRNADVIVLSRDGFAYGHFDITAKVKPNREDKRNYPAVRFVYLVSRSTLYETPVRLFDIGIKNYQYGRRLTEAEFADILERAGETQEFANISIAEELPEGKYAEGTARRIRVNAYERNPAAVMACKRYYGTQCQVCGLDMGKLYGEIGVGFIHVHHLTLLSKIGKTYSVDPVKDLLPVCPNCHAMLHTANPPLGIEQLKIRLKGIGI